MSSQFLLNISEYFREFWKILESPEKQSWQKEVDNFPTYSGFQNLLSREMQNFNLHLLLFLKSKFKLD